MFFLKLPNCSKALGPIGVLFRLVWSKIGGTALDGFLLHLPGPSIFPILHLWACAVFLGGYGVFSLDPGYSPPD